jgi:hypothetical protein
VKIISMALTATVAMIAAACERPSGILLPPAAEAAAAERAGAAYATINSVCTPGGRLVVGGGGGSYYNHLANSEMSPDACWSKSRWTSHVSTVCPGGYPTWNEAGYQFGYASSVSQQVVIPDSAQYSATTWFLDYRLDFVDPNNDGANNVLNVTAVRLRRRSVVVN